MSMSLILGNDNPNADPYAGLTFEYLNYDVDSNGDAWDWETVTHGGSNPPLVFTPDFDQAPGADPAGEAIQAYQEGREIVFKVPGHSQTYRSEHTMEEHLNYKNANARQYMADDGTQYAIAYAFEFEIFLKDTTTPNQDMDKLFDEAIIMQVHENNNEGPSWSLKIDGADNTLRANIKHAAINDTAAGTMETFTRYEIVFGYLQNDGGDDKIECWVNGVKFQDEVGATLWGTNEDNYLKWGIYLVDRKSEGNAYDDYLRLDMNSFGMYSGVDAIAAAKIRVQGNQHV